MLLIGRMNKKTKLKTLSYDGEFCGAPVNNIIFENDKYLITLVKNKFELYDISQGRYTLYLTAVSIKNKVIRINILESSTFNRLRAHLFYKILIDLGYILWTDEQSDGGHAVWRRLSKYPDVNIHGWDGKQAVNLDIIDDEEQMFISVFDKKDEIYNSIKKITLVGHKNENIQRIYTRSYNDRLGEWFKNKKNKNTSKQW